MKDIKAMKVIINYLYTIRQCLLLLVTVVFSLAGCSDETLVEPVSNEVTVTLRFSQMGQITTRVNEEPYYPYYKDMCKANENECYIERCTLLFYDYFERYVGEFTCDLSRGLVIESGGQVVIKFDQPIPSDAQRVVILCNCSEPFYYMWETYCDELKTILSGKVTFNSYMGNINGSDNGKMIPMFGFSNEVNSNYIDCTMYFSVAKIQLAISKEIYDPYYGDDEYTWSLCNVPRSGNVYTDAGFKPWEGLSWDYVTPCFLDLTKESSGLSFKNCDVSLAQPMKDPYRELYYDVPHPEPTENKTYYYYSPEHQNSVRTPTGDIIDANAFDSRRTCILLKKETGSWNDRKVWYYRIDFLTGNGKDETKQFFDILRHRHYQVTVTKMAETGYATEEEALANPSSNIEYKIDGITEENTSSNGQYILDFTQEWNYLEYYEDNAIGKEVVIGYVKAIYADGVEYNLTTNDIGLSIANDAGELELSDPDQKITTERTPIKIKLNKQAEEGKSWSKSFDLNLKLGNITRSFHYGISAKTGCDWLGYLTNFQSRELNGGMISIEDIPDSFIHLTKKSEQYTLKVLENKTSNSRTQSAVITSYNNPGIYKRKFMITQRGKE